MRHHLRLLYLAIIPPTILAGLIVRFVPLGLSPFLVKYGGSTLWAVTLYWLAGVLAPHLQSLGRALLTGILATLVELSRLIHIPALDAFRLTLAGILLLGRYFSPRNILAYWLAILAAAAADHLLLLPRIRATLR